MLGHASIIHTMDTYSHVMPDMKRDFADKKKLSERDICTKFITPAIVSRLLSPEALSPWEAPGSTTV